MFGTSQQVTAGRRLAGPRDGGAHGGHSGGFWLKSNKKKKIQFAKVRSIKRDPREKAMTTAERAGSVSEQFEDQDASKQNNPFIGVCTRQKQQARRTEEKKHTFGSLKDPENAKPSRGGSAAGGPPTSLPVSAVATASAAPYSPLIAGEPQLRPSPKRNPDSNRLAKSGYFAK